MATAYRHYRRRMSVGFAIIGPQHEADCLEAIAEGVVRVNQIMIRAEPDHYPCCLGCGKYKYVPPESCKVFDWKQRQPVVDPGCQHVHGAYDLELRKEGTCIDLACMLCAIYREKDDDRAARVGIDFLRDGDRPIPGHYHALVIRGDGVAVDPVEKVTGNRQFQACGCEG